jgi:hypothetical protein
MSKFEQWWDSYWSGRVRVDLGEAKRYVLAAWLARGQADVEACEELHDGTNDEADDRTLAVSRAIKELDNG